jgi:ubiquinone/menaquinone biosynthesis C-methylase UbiE
MTQPHDIIKTDVIGMYDRAAPIYNQVGVKRFTYFGDLLIDRLNLPEGAKVLDLATGRGSLLFAASQKVGESGHVTGIDLAPNMIALTQAEIIERGITNASVSVMDTESASFPADSFDFIVCGFALHFMEFEHVLANCYSWLKSGGVFASSHPYIPQGENLDQWRWLFELTRAVFPPDFKPPAAWISPNRLSTPEKVQAAFEAAGFSDVRTELHTHLFHFRDEDDWWDFQWSQGSRFWLEGMSPDGLERFKRESFAHLANMKTPQGIPF